MPVLVVRKTTNYELHGPALEAKVREGRVPRETLERLKNAHDEHYKTLETLRAHLARVGVRFDEVSREECPDPDSYDAVITVGGDGTLLAASHAMVSGGRLMGIRSSVSSVGFLCAASPEYGAAESPGTIQRQVDALLDGTAATIRIQRLMARVQVLETGRELQTVPVVNDVLYTNANPAATTRYEIGFRGIQEIHRSSGLWTATATGSTAAIHAAGGEKRPIEDKKFQFRVRELYRLGLTKPTIEAGLFDPDVEDLWIDNRCPVGLLALDGQHGTFSLAYGDRIRFARATPLQLVGPLTRRL